MKYKTSREIFEESKNFSEDSYSLLEKVLADSKPIIDLGRSREYLFYNDRPTELSSGGYVDWAGDDD